MNYELRIKNRKRLIYLLIFGILNTYFLIHNTAPLALGQTMSNSSYIIQMGNLNEAAGRPTGPSYKLNITVGQTGPGLYSGANYTVRAGFQYISSIIPFRFTVDQIFVDFGSLSPTNPVTRTSILTVNNQSAGGYTVKAYENHPLQIVSTSTQIPDTTCDSGTCTETTATAWTSTLAYGFGYRCDIVDATNYCNGDFSTSTFYKQFANNTTSEIAQTIMSGQSGRNQKGQVTYKVNISSVQEAGLYSNQIVYIATPTY